jgi:hypothetical protein
MSTLTRNNPFLKRTNIAMIYGFEFHKRRGLVRRTLISVDEEVITRDKTETNFSNQNLS